MRNYLEIYAQLKNLTSLQKEYQKYEEECVVKGTVFNVGSSTHGVYVCLVVPGTDVGDGTMFCYFSKTCTSELIGLAKGTLVKITGRFVLAPNHWEMHDCTAIDTTVIR